MECTLFCDFVCLYFRVAHNFHHFSSVFMISNKFISLHSFSFRIALSCEGSFDSRPAAKTKTKTNSTHVLS